MVNLLSLATAIAALSTIWAKSTERERWVYVFKPLTTILILLLALQAPDDPCRYKALIVLGLLFSLSGDIFLMLPQDRFIPGLIGFLLAHLSYTAAFALPRGLRFSIWWVLPGITWALVLLWLLRGNLDSMRIPVFVYALIILTMAGQALERNAATGTSAARWAAIGAVLFVTSDSVLALNRFRRRYKGADAVVLGTYYIAQWLIALSVEISR